MTVYPIKVHRDIQLLEDRNSEEEIDSNAQRRGTIGIPTSSEERTEGSTSQVRRTRILLHSDVKGSAWMDEKTIQVYDGHFQRVAGVRRRFVENSFCWT